MFWPENYMSTQKIGFFIEATSNPVVAPVPVATAFVGYMVSITGTALQHEELRTHLIVFILTMQQVT